MDGISEREFYTGVLQEARPILEGSGRLEEKLAALCKLLRARVAHYDWVGIYRVESPGWLALGPYEGAPTEHARIQFGRGICGQAAERGETFVVQDVSRESNYLSCSVNVKSEIVLPVFSRGVLVGELDIDSHTLSPFSPEDLKFLEKVCTVLGELEW